MEDLVVARFVGIMVKQSEIMVVAVGKFKGGIAVRWVVSYDFGFIRNTFVRRNSLLMC